jgi:hypothetical protein
MIGTDVCQYADKDTIMPVPESPDLSLPAALHYETPTVGGMVSGWPAVFPPPRR